MFAKAVKNFRKRVREWSGKYDELKGITAEHHAEKRRRLTMTRVPQSVDLDQLCLAPIFVLCAIDLHIDLVCMLKASTRPAAHAVTPPLFPRSRLQKVGV